MLLHHTIQRIIATKDLRFAHTICRTASTIAPKALLRSLPSTPARTRFAPSPTGYLHLGSLRTALFNYLLAKATGGQFILRIEDTDQKRTIGDAVRRICEDLQWAGLPWDEGPEVGGPYGPYHQSERTALYKDHADKLIASGNAYRCFCSSERLSRLAAERSKLGLSLEYDRTCAGIPRDVSEERAVNGWSYTIRLKSPSQYPKYQDLVYGLVGNSSRNQKRSLISDAFDDPILLKSDGMPTYHLANVVDDHLMRITHVVRAAEWMPSTPKHLALYQAFRWDPPAFAHVGLLQNEKGEKLSKRHGAPDIPSFVRQGAFPEALTNYAALLGWSHRERSDILPMRDLIQKFDLRFTKGNAIVNLQKLSYLQRQYGQRYVEADGEELRTFVGKICNGVPKNLDVKTLHLPSNHVLESYVASILKVDAKHIAFVADFWDRHLGFFDDAVIRDRPANNASSRGLITKAIALLSAIPDSSWDKVRIGEAIDALVLGYDEPKPELEASMTEQQEESKAYKAASSHVSREIRWATMGGRSGPPMQTTMEILGRDQTLKRLRDSLDDCS